MKFNLGVHEQSVGMVDLETLAQECEISYEAAVQAGYECKEMEIILDNMRFAKNAIALNGVEWYINNCDNTNELGRVLGKSTEDLTVDAATEGIKKLAAEAWDKIKAFFARIWKWMRDAYDRLTSSVTEKKLTEVENNLKKLGSSDEVFKRVSFSGDRPIMTFKTVDAIYDRVKEMKKKYDAYSDLPEKHLKNVQKALKKGTSKLDDLKDDVETLKEKVEELRTLSNEIKKMKDESGNDTSVGSDLTIFQLGYNAYKMIRLCSFIRDMQGEMEKIKKNEEKLEELKAGVTKLCDSVIVSGSEGLSVSERLGYKEDDARDAYNRITGTTFLAAVIPTLFMSGPLMIGAIAVILTTGTTIAFKVEKLINDKKSESDK